MSTRYVALGFTNGPAGSLYMSSLLLPGKPVTLDRTFENTILSRIVRKAPEECLLHVCMSVVGSLAPQSEYGLTDTFDTIRQVLQRCNGRHPDRITGLFRPFRTMHFPATPTVRPSAPWVVLHFGPIPLCLQPRRDPHHGTPS